jgi:hypothetical protein
MGKLVRKVVASSSEVPAWVSRHVLDCTQSVWSKAYGRAVSEAEALEILGNVRRVTEFAKNCIGFGRFPAAS